MKVLAINGSSRKKGNTDILLDKVLQPLQESGFACEKVWLGNDAVKVCLGCRKCAENKNRKCVIDSDNINDLVQKMVGADVIVLGSPVYVAGITAQMKAFLDRAALVCRANGFLLKHKIGASLVAVRRAGALPAVDMMNHFFAIQQMFTVGSTYWNFGLGNAIGEVESDSEGLKNMENLGENIAFLANKLRSPENGGENGRF